MSSHRVNNIIPVLAFALAWLVSLQASAGFMPSQSQILSDMVLANSHFTNEWPTPGCRNCLTGSRPSCIWTRATYIEGALALFRVNHDPLIYKYATNWGAYTNWCLRYNLDSTDRTPDDQGAGMDYLELYQLDPTQTQRLTHITNNLNSWVARPDVGYLYYVDALHMSMQAFARAGVVLNQTNYLEKMYDYFHFAKSVIGPSNGLYSVSDHLWYRDTNFLHGYIASDGTAQKCYWSRGNGWAFAALARVMEVLPTNDTHYAEYLQTFKEMAAALKAVQRTDGFWNVNLAYTNDFPGPETSGTSCFTYGMAWGINHGYLDTNTYLPAVIRGWNALANSALHHTNGVDNGFLGYVQSSGSKPSDGQPVTYTKQPDFDDFALGLMLLAGSQVYQLSGPESVMLSPPTVKTNQVQLALTVISNLTNGMVNLLETDQLQSDWKTNTTATLSTDIDGYSYRFTTTNNAGDRFFKARVGL